MIVVRLNRYLAECGVSSRRNADKLIEDGLVKVNGKVAELGLEINENKDNVEYGGKKIKRELGFEYYIMNKPKGCVCTVKDDKNRKTVMDFLPETNLRLFPVGRLDYDTEGLLLFTNDGDLAFRLTHPKNEIPKTYSAKIKGEISQEELTTLRKGVLIEGKKTNRASVYILERVNGFTKISVTISEGRNRQVRKMFEAIEKEVTFLKRTKVGDLTVSGLKRGEVRKLTIGEVNYLKNL